jgi:hypothetical protein
LKERKEKPREKKPKIHNFFFLKVKQQLIITP